MLLDPCQQCIAGTDVVLDLLLRSARAFQLYFNIATRLAREHTISLKCMLVHSSYAVESRTCV